MCHRASIFIRVPPILRKNHAIPIHFHIQIPSSFTDKYTNEPQSPNPDTHRKSQHTWTKPPEHASNATFSPLRIKPVSHGKNFPGISGHMWRIHLRRWPLMSLAPSKPLQTETRFLMPSHRPLGYQQAVPGISRWNGPRAQHCSTNPTRRKWMSMPKVPRQSSCLNVNSPNRTEAPVRKRESETAPSPAMVTMRHPSSPLRHAHRSSAGIHLLFVAP